MSDMLGCVGKRHYPSKSRALRGLKALAREQRNSADSRGHLAVYACDCGQWCVGRGYEGRPLHKRRAPMRAEDFGDGAAVFAVADAIAKERFPGGANAGELGRIIREVLRARDTHPKDRDAKQGSARE